MVVNILGECDRRVVLYTLMKITQTLGDVLVLTSDQHLLRLSDTGESGGHYQNTMIVHTTDGVDDYLANAQYMFDDFDFVLVDGIPCADADLFLYVQGLSMSEEMSTTLSFIEDYKTIKMMQVGYTGRSTFNLLEQFEALGTMCTISSKMSETIAKLLEPVLNISAKTLYAAATSSTTNNKRR